MDATNAMTFATVLAGFLSPIIVQVSKKYIPFDWVAVYSLLVSLVIGVIAVAATNGFSTHSWGVVLFGVIGVSQTVYTLLNKSLSGELSLDVTNKP